MIDNFSSESHNYPEEKFTKVVEHPMTSNYRDYGNRATVDLGNLRITYYPLSRKLTVKNSLHCAYNLFLNDLIQSPVNYNDFSRENFIEIVTLLETILQVSSTDMKLFGRFEAGININIAPLNPREFSNSFISIINGATNKFSWANNSRGKPIMRVCHFGDYYVKAYDKSIQAELATKGILRFELVSKGLARTKKILNKDSPTLHDLTKANTWGKLEDWLINTYDKIIKLPVYEETLKREELLELYAYAEPAIRAFDRKKLSQHQLNEFRRDCKSKLAQMIQSPSSIHFGVRKRMVTKIRNLSS